MLGIFYFIRSCDWLRCLICSYILWKVVARHLTTPEQRTQFCSTVGRVLLDDLGSSQQQQLAQAAEQAGGKAPVATLVTCMQQLLQQLKSDGYICAYQLVWGTAPGTWPADWATQPDVVGDVNDTAAQDASGLPFQASPQHWVTG